MKCHGDHAATELPRFDQSQRRCGGLEPLGGADLRHTKGVRVTGVGIDQPPGGGVEDPIEDGEIHLGLRQFTSQ